ncbi:MAG: ParB/RepB/Spo0J family partition protein [Fimbriimonadales bacterium]|nr:ParB/RepB/Spo0J family partition protein [Fimbriimonadales bacterium]
MRRALGKGLAQLIGESQSEGTQEVSIDSIVPNPQQPRKRFSDESLQELADSIKEIGVLQPLVVRPLDEGRYELIAGERRLRAAKLAGLTSVPILIRGADRSASLQIALIENVQREDISVLEAAEAYARLVHDFGLTQEEIAQRVGKSRPSIANALRLLKLPVEIREALASGSISEGHARALLQFDTETEMMLAHQQIIEKGLNVRDVEKLARGEAEAQATGTKAKVAKRESEFDTQLSEFFGSPARLIRQGKRGKIEIDFFDDETLSGILDRIGFTRD